MSGKNKACFLDRDGVLIVEKNYLADVDEIELEKGAAQAVKTLNEHGYLVVVVSNQSGVARGYFSEELVRRIHSRIDELLAEHGAVVDGWFFCPHHPDGTISEYARLCRCRKPEPGMLLSAADEYDIDISGSFMIGDKTSDLDAAARAGCARSIMVLTGHGSGEEPGGRETAANILDAVNMLLNGT